jgi:ribosome-binding protein aMBF1 (putative translation factor)
MSTQKIEEMIRERREERGLPPREISKKNVKKPSVVASSITSEGLSKN